jgi:hypothetical protein
VSCCPSNFAAPKKAQLLQASLGPAKGSLPVQGGKMIAKDSLLGIYLELSEVAEMLGNCGTNITTNGPLALHS